MIKAHELRLGNLLLEAGEVSGVYMIDRGGISFYRINDIAVNKETGCTLNGGEDRFKPIALTHEWLERFGFEKRETTEDGEYWGILNFTLIYGRYDGGKYGWFLNGYHNDCYIEYVHHLQNVFFILRNQELTIKEPLF